MEQRDVCQSSAFRKTRREGLTEGSGSSSMIGTDDLLLKRSRRTRFFRANKSRTDPDGRSAGCETECESSSVVDSSGGDYLDWKTGERRLNRGWISLGGERREVDVRGDL